MPDDRLPVPDRYCLHFDLDACFAAIEAIEDPTLAGKPVIVGARPGTRGVVSTCSYEARALGIHSAMPINEAYRRCPQGVFLPVRHTLYRQYSDRVFKIVARHTDRMQPISIDEAFVDLSGFHEPEAVARNIKQQIRSEVGLVASMGLASSKLVAKVASDQGKPDGFVVVPHGAEAAFLAPLPVRRLWGVGPKTATRLIEAGIETIGAIASAEPGLLIPLVGPKYARELQQHALGIDDSPVEIHREIKSISEEVTFQRDEDDRRILWEVLRTQADECVSRLTDRGLVARTVTIKLRYSDFRTATRAMTLSACTQDAEVIREAAAALMRRCWALERLPLRLLGLRLSGLQPSSGFQQLLLDLDPQPPTGIN